MTKLEKFKTFVGQNPILITYVRNNQMTWQKFYEIYDLYGENNNVWNEYLQSREVPRESNNINSDVKIPSFHDLINMAKNIDVEKVQGGITSLQKALGLFSDLFIKDASGTSTNEYQPRPIHRKFDD